MRLQLPQLGPPPTLLAALKILGGPEGADAKAWTWELPSARAQKLSDFHVGFVLDDPIAPPAPDVRAVLENTIENLRRAGAKLKPGWPANFQPSPMLETYRYLLFSFFISRSPDAVKNSLRAEFERIAGPAAAEALGSAAYWQEQNMRRLEYRARWQAHFDGVDVFLSPVTFTPAFPHDHSEPQSSRKIHTVAGPRSYMEGLNWMGLASLTGCPATVAPVGRTKAGLPAGDKETGLPVGLQIMGPYWEDATPLAFADLLAQEFGGFSPPPGYGN